MPNPFIYDNIIFVAGKRRMKTQNATVVQLVVRHLAKVEVAGSSPVCRSTYKLHFNPVNEIEMQFFFL